MSGLGWKPPPLNSQVPGRKIPGEDPNGSAGRDFSAGGREDIKSEGGQTLFREKKAMKTVSYRKESKAARVPWKPSTGTLHDLAAQESCEIAPNTVVAVSTGIQLELPKGHIGQIFSRSSLALQHDITVPSGTIDDSYRGTIFVLLRNNGSSPFRVQEGDRVAQLAILAPLAVNFVEKETLGATERGEGRFGSTGGQCL